MNAAQIRNRER